MTQDTRPFADDLNRASVEWMDAAWDPEAGLLWAPDRTRHLVRETAWYALGLLERDQPGDADRAHTALHRVLDHQYQTPGTVYHGTFRRAPQEPAPPPDPKMWVDYDPNWRQFIGTVLAVIVERFVAMLPADLTERIDQALVLCVDGEQRGRVTAAYSNIALMKAWLQVFVGERHGRPDLLTDGAGLAAEVVQRFERHGTFDEYNSPTYYGVDLYALGLWRSCGPPLLRELGQSLEAALWRDIADLYHAGLQNLCGPFDRAYGMDMRAYAALLGLCVWGGCGRDVAPFPDVSRPFGHAADLCMGPAIAAAGMRVPDDVVEGVRSFTVTRSVRRTVAGSPAREVTAWLSGNLMIGAQDASAQRSAVSQYHPATVHFATAAGGVGWIRARSLGRIDAVARPGELVVAYGPHPERGPQTVTFEFGGVEPESLGAARWVLGSLDVEVDTDTPVAGTGPGPRHSITYEAPSDRASFVLRMRT